MADQLPTKIMECLLDQMSVITKIRLIRVSKQFQAAILKRMDTLALDEAIIAHDLNSLDFQDAAINILKNYGERVKHLKIVIVGGVEKIGCNQEILPRYCPHLESLEVRDGHPEGWFSDPNLSWSQSLLHVSPEVFLALPESFRSMTAFMHTEEEEECQQILRRIRAGGVNEFSWLNVNSEVVFNCLIDEVQRGGPLPTLSGICVSSAGLQDVMGGPRAAVFQTMATTLRKLDLWVPSNFALSGPLSQFTNLTTFSLVAHRLKRENEVLFDFTFLSAYGKLQRLKIDLIGDYQLTGDHLAHLPETTPLEEINLGRSYDVPLLVMMMSRNYQLKSIRAARLPQHDPQGRYLAGWLNGCAGSLKTICFDKSELGVVMEHLSEALAANLAGVTMVCEDGEVVTTNACMGQLRKFLDKRLRTMIADGNAIVYRPKWCRLKVGITGGCDGQGDDWSELRRLAEVEGVVISIDRFPARREIIEIGNVDNKGGDGEMAAMVEGTDRIRRMSR